MVSDKFCDEFQRVAMNLQLKNKIKHLYNGLKQSSFDKKFLGTNLGSYR